MRVNITSLRGTLIIAAVLFCGNAFPQFLPERYHRYQQVADTLLILQNSFPDILKFDTLGYSTRDSVPMLRLKISDNPGVDEDEPAIFIFGGEHADEVLGPEVVLGFITDIVRKYELGDPVVRSYIHSIEIFAIPFINPDGHIVVENGNTHWRKNTCDNDSNGVFDFHDGVDNNRNYDLGWEIDTEDSSTFPENSMYRGTAPFTQLENCAIRDFAWKYRPLVCLDYHSPTVGLSEKAYYNWYWYTSVGGHGMAPDEPLMAYICRQYCSRIINDAGDSTYEARRGLVNKGDMKTYMYGNFGTAAFTVEVSDTTIQDSSLVDGIAARNLPGIYFLMERLLGPGITGIIRDSVTFEPLEAEVQVLEAINADIKPRLSRPDFGRYRRILAPGTYTLKFIKENYISKTLTVNVNSTEPANTDILLSPMYPRPPAPLLVYPGPGDTISDTKFTFEWTDEPLASKYLLDAASDSMFNEIIISDSTLLSSEFTIDSGLVNGAYYWRVRGGNENGWGPFTAGSKFYVDVFVNADEIKPELSYRLGQNYPNPFNPSTIIEYEVPRQCHVSLKIFDILGNEIAGVVNEIKPAGKYKAVFNASTLANGVYFYRIQAGEFREVRKMVLVK